MVEVIPVPVLADNYSYLLATDPENKLCAAVDPAEPDKVLKAAEERGWKVTAILTTHHHDDHAGGNADFLKLVPDIPVYGGDSRIMAISQSVEDNKAFTLGKLQITPLFTICHTSGSVSYYVTDPSSSSKVVFTGDTLFIAGCGRFFEGTPEQMHHSLNNVLGNLPDDTKVYCGHEYTTSNLKFAAHVEPENPDIQSKLSWCASNAVTVPSTIGAEKTFNPFMRVEVPAVVAKVGGGSAVEVMGKLREMKNNF
ncbi:hypothetical protein HDU96_001913 [Phlyctochytrium bullatum]|nr:hypothetical protein HDU96_001913 [Phlyctochytrium bullatum]